MTQHVRRGLLILLAGLAVTLAILPLGGLGWADRIRIHEQDRQLAREKYQHSHPAPARRPNPPQSTWQRYCRGFGQVVVFELGLPCAIALSVLAYTRRKRPKLVEPARSTP